MKVLNVQSQLNKEVRAINWAEQASLPHLALTLPPVTKFPSQIAESTISSKVVHLGCCGWYTFVGLERGPTPKTLGHEIFLLRLFSFCVLAPTSDHRTCVIIIVSASQVIVPAF